MPYYVYILESLKDGQYYKGYSEHPVLRLKRHNDGETISTRPFIPWKLIYIEVMISKSAAIAREKNLKKTTRERITHLLSHRKNIVDQYC